MKTRTIGGRDVSAIGLGAMPMSVEGRPEREQSLRTIHAALDAGVTLVDTADAYHARADGLGHNEDVVAEALRTWGGDSSSVLVATKGGHVRPDDGSWALDGTPEHLKRAAQDSARRLGVDAIGLYQFHRPDPEVPFAESVGALADLLDAGTIAMAGVSNADPEQIRTAQDVLGGRLASVQNQFSPSFRSSERELRLCDELGVAFMPWSPLGGISNAADLGTTAAAFAEVGEQLGVSPQRVALAWQLAKSPCVVPIPGSSRPETIQDSAHAVDVRLSADQMARLDAA